MIQPRSITGAMYRSANWRTSTVWSRQKGRDRSTSGGGNLNGPGVRESRTNDCLIGELADRPAHWLSFSLRPERGWDTDSMAVLSLWRSDVDNAEVSAVPEKASGLLHESGHG